MSSCNLTQKSGGDAVPAAIDREDPVTISHTPNNGIVESFLADVKVYEEHSRDVDGRVLVNEYRLAMKILDGTLCMRMDYSADSKGNARSVIANAEEMIIFDRNRNKVEYRMPNDPDDMEKVELGSSLFGKIDMEEVKAMYRAESYRMIESDNSRYVIFETPSSLLTDFTIAGEKVYYEKTVYDTVLGVQSGLEYQVVTADGITITTNVADTFQECDGIPVKTGQVTTSTYEYPFRLDTSDRLIPVLDSLEDADPISEEELQKLIDHGAVIKNYKPVLGDPGTLDYTITTFEEYRNIDLDSVSEDVFRINL